MNDHTNPYRQALDFVETHKFLGSAANMGKLLLSLWDDTNAFSVRECINNLDRTNIDIALRCITRFAENGKDDAALCEAGERVNVLMPRLRELGQAANDAKLAVLERFRREDRARADAEEEANL